MEETSVVKTEDTKITKEKQYTSIEKISFEACNDMFITLHMTFHPENYGEDEDIDMRIISLWNVFLTMAGWTEDEYWAESNLRDEEEEFICTECQEAHSKETLHETVTKEVAAMLSSMKSQDNN